MRLSGIRMPTVRLLFLNNLGMLLLALRIKVNGPGRVFFISLKVVLSYRAA